MTERNELTIRFSTAPGTVDENIAAVKSQVEAWLQDFNDLDSYTDEKIPDLQKKVADLRKGRKLIDDERKRIKKTYLVPLDEFEAKVKTITTLIDDTINVGTCRVDAFEKLQDKKKRDTIEAWWKAHRPLETLDLSLVWDSKFLNKSGPGAKWEQILTARIEDINADLKLLAADIMEDTARGNYLSAVYMRTLNYPECVRQWNQHVESEKARLAAMQKNEELRRAREEAEKKAAAEREQRKEETPAPKEERPQAQEQQVQDAKFYTLTFRMVNIPEELVRSLNNTMTALGIKKTVKEQVITDENGEVLKKIIRDDQGNVIERWVKEES